MSTYILVIDYILGLIMWTLIGRSAMNLFQREDSEFFFMKIFVKLTNPIINLFKFITPSFLIPIFIPLYVAWFFYLFRFYAMPYLLGYSVMGMLSFPLRAPLRLRRVCKRQFQDLLSFSWLPMSGECPPPNPQHADCR